MKRQLRQLRRLYQAWANREYIRIEARITYETARRFLVDHQEMHAWLAKKRVEVEEVDNGKVLIRMPKWYYIKHFENRYHNRDRSW